MRLIHRGVMVELEDTDVRVAMIEALIFSTALPEAIRVVLPEEPARDLVPERVRTFWNRLSEVSRRELALLSERRYAAKELEHALGITQPRLTALHSRLSRLASECGVRIGVRKMGRIRADRRYEIKGEEARWVGVLAAE